MKKILALICSVVLTAAVFAGCGSSNGEGSSKAAESTSSAAGDSEKEKESAGSESEGEESSESSNENNAESDADSSTASSSLQGQSADSSSKASDSSTADAGFSEEDIVPADTAIGEYGQKYNDLLKSRKFVIEMSVDDEMLGSSSMLVEYNGANYHMSVESSFYSADMYCVDDALYMMDASSKTYYKLGSASALSEDDDPADVAMGIGDGYEFIGTVDQGDTVVEIYRRSFGDLGIDELNDTDSESRYYFNKADGTLKRIESSAFGVTESVNVTRISTDVSEIKLPDLTGWTEESMDTDLDMEYEYEGDDLGTASVADERSQE